MQHQRNGHHSYALRIGFLICISSLLLLTACAGSEATSDASSSSSSSNATADSVSQESPQLVGGRSALREAIDYPSDVLQPGEERTARIEFTLNEKGEITEHRVLSSAGFALDSALIKALYAVEWIPGKKDGVPVNVNMTIPFRFAGPDQWH